MSKGFLDKYFPSPEEIKNHKSLAFLRNFIHDPFLWHINRKSISGAFANGLFFAWVPVPFQMALAAIFAIIFRVNLPVSVGLVWLTNPVTMPPMFYGAYRLGLFLLNQPSKIEHFEFSYEWLQHSMGMIWQPFLLGCFVIGVISSVTGYFAVRIIWKYNAGKKWRKRQLRR